MKRPQGWKIKQLSEVAKIVRGSSPRPAGDPRFFDGDFLPWITVAEVTKDASMFLYSTKSSLTRDGANYTRVIEPNTLLLTNSGATLGVPKINTIRAGANDGIAAFLNLIEDSRFLFYALQDRTRYFRERLAPGVGQPNLNTELIGSIVLPFPPTNEQRKIAKILSTWDEALEKLDALIVAKERGKKALAQEFFERQRHAKRDYIKTSEVFTNRSERNDQGAPILSVTQDQGVVRRDSLDRRIMADEANGVTYKLVYPGDFVISLRSFQGGLEYSPLFGAVSPAYHVITARREIDHAFFRHYFKSYEFVGRLAVAVIGIRDGKQISFDDFAFMQIPFPHLDEQCRIARVLDICDAEIRLLRDQRAAIDRQKRGLMQRLLTGKVRVKP